MAKVLDFNHSLSPTVHVFVNKTFQTDRLILYSYTLYLAYAVIFFIGLVANIFVIVMIIKRRRMRTLTNRFLLNLAVSDLIATVVCLPPTAYHHHDRSWPFGQFLCRFVPFMQGEKRAARTCSGPTDRACHHRVRGRGVGEHLEAKWAPCVRYPLENKGMCRLGFSSWTKASVEIALRQQK